MNSNIRMTLFRFAIRHLYLISSCLGRIPMRNENIAVRRWNDIEGEDWRVVEIYEFITCIRRSRCSHRQSWCRTFSSRPPVHTNAGFICLSIRCAWHVHLQRQSPSFGKLPLLQNKNKKKNEIRAIEDEKKLLKICNCFDCVKLFVEIMSGAANLFLPVEIDTGENCEYVRFTSMASRKCVSQFVFAIAISIASRHIYQSEENGTCKQVSQPRRVCRALSLPPAK